MSTLRETTLPPRVQGEEERLAIALDVVPRGALVLAGLAVGSLLAAWLAMFIFVFLARGSVG